MRTVRRGRLVESVTDRCSVCGSAHFGAAVAQSGNAGRYKDGHQRDEHTGDDLPI
jgi:hypothetical protein